MISLPVCRHRGPALPNGNSLCVSPKLITTEAGVTQSICAQCPYVDHAIEPGLAAKLANFAAATVKHVLSGSPKTTDEQYAERVETCSGCEACDKTDKSWKCLECGCSIREVSLMSSKARWASEKCPKGLWPKIELTVVKSKCGGCGCGS
jgi:hypothetical protein